MKKLLIIPTILLALTVVQGQTNVSGGIYSNTTWTLVNSPYIVVDTVVVFPGVTLTIQPGVVVKFANNKVIEIRQSKLIATGTAVDSITFTSNAVSPTQGIYAGIYLSASQKCNFSFCNFYYANKGIFPCQNDTLTINNSTFKNNTMGLGYNYGFLTLIQNCIFSNNTNAIIGYTGRYIIQNCRIVNNQNGIIQCEGITIENCIIDSNSVIGIETSQNDTVRFNEIKYNGTGLKISTSGGMGQSIIHNNQIENNNLGIELCTYADHIFCNKICNNTTYDLKYTYYANSNSIANNYWCTLDSMSTAAVIYDGYDNISLGLLSFMPLDTIQCYLENPSFINKILNTNIIIFPNPFSTQAVLQTDKTLYNATLTVDNCFGQTVKEIKNISGQTITFHRDNLSNGLYFLRLTQDSKIIATKKLIIID